MLRNRLSCKSTFKKPKCSVIPKITCRLIYGVNNLQYSNLYKYSLFSPSDASFMFLVYFIFLQEKILEIQNNLD